MRVGARIGAGALALMFVSSSLMMLAAPATLGGCCAVGCSSFVDGNVIGLRQSGEGALDIKVQAGPFSGSASVTFTPSSSTCTNVSLVVCDFDAGSDTLHFELGPGVTRLGGDAIRVEVTASSADGTYAAFYSAFVLVNSHSVCGEQCDEARVARDIDFRRGA